MIKFVVEILAILAGGAAVACVVLSIINFELVWDLLSEILVALANAFKPRT